jgi:hypothetical protein
MRHALFSHIRAAKGNVTGGEGDQRYDNENDQPAAHDLILCLIPEPV